MEIDNPQGALHPFTPVRACVTVPGRQSLAVPRRAVTAVGGKTVVYVSSPPAADGSRALHRRPLQVDLAEPGDQVEVLFGLAAGEQVVVGEAATWAQQLLAACR